MECRIADLSKYRFSCCHEVLGDAKIMYEAGRYKTALNRVYYSIFHGMRAVTALGSFDSNKHCTFNLWLSMQVSSPSKSHTAVVTSISLRLAFSAGFQFPQAPVSPCHTLRQIHHDTLFYHWQILRIVVVQHGIQSIYFVSPFFPFGNIP